MRSNSLEITTAHNIIMRFESATTIQRALAWFIDAIILFVYILLCSALFGEYDVLYFIVIFPIFTFYHLLMEIYNNGQSIGKKILGIRVVSLNGSTPSLNAYFVRWTFRLLDITTSLGILAILFSSSSEKHQRIGDIIAGTSVVKTQNENSIKLSSIEKVHPKKEILYPKMTTFTDSDMLLVKQSLNRYAQFPNDANKNVLVKLADKIQKRLNVKISANETKKFLDRVLYEYIILTR